MSENRKSERPYRTLGWYLKFAREQLKESLPEVSGAVEIDTEVLEKIERGEQRPSEEILALLISHLDLEEPEANSLWELAGYSKDNVIPEVEDMKQQIALVMPMDLRVVYTDKAHVVVNDSGVVMNFLQGGPNNQTLAVARVGMSKEHAKSVLDILQKALSQQDEPNQPKFLKAPKKINPRNKKSN